MKLLLVEDDFELCGALTRALQRRGFDVSATGDGLEALRLARAGAFDLVLLDLSLPSLDGLQVLQRLRGSGHALPILILTARGTVGDRVVGLNAGADDYMAKPFDLDELEARVRALVRRSQSDVSQCCGQLSFELSSGAFYCQGKPLEFTPREHNLLKCLIHKPGHAVSKEKLLAHVFMDEPGTLPDAVEVVVHRLRKKLIPTGAEIMTLRGLGYALVERQDA